MDACRTVVRSGDLHEFCHRQFAEHSRHRSRGLAPIVHGAHHQIGTAHGVATDEYLRMAGLERQSARTAGTDAAPPGLGIVG